MKSLQKQTVSDNSLHRVRRRVRAWLILVCHVMKVRVSVFWTIQIYWNWWGGKEIENETRGWLTHRKRGGGGLRQVILVCMIVKFKVLFNNLVLYLLLLINIQHSLFSWWNMALVFNFFFLNKKWDFKLKDIEKKLKQLDRYWILISFSVSMVKFKV